MPSPYYRISVTINCASICDCAASVEKVIEENGAALRSTDRNIPAACCEMIIDTCSKDNQRQVIEALRALTEIKIQKIVDKTFEMHLGGKIEVSLKTPLETRDDLSMAYTPGVARVSTAVSEDRAKSFGLTMRRNMVAVVSDGSAVLGLGNIGPEGAMPVMEGKAMLFKEFGGVDAFPVCLATQDVEEIIRTVAAIAPTFGGINLEDISAPRCFEIEDRLRAMLDIPVFHDDQHGTAAVSLAALINASKLIGKDISGMKAVVSGAGAAGVACTKAMIALGIGDVILCDTKGSIYKGRSEGMNPAKEWLAENTNADGFKGSLKDALKGADLLLGVSGPNLLKGEDLKVMAKDPMVFAMSNPVPEVMPEDAAPYVRIMATGRSDYPNQINNVLCFPGLFRGLLDCYSRTVTQEMVIAAGKAIASVVKANELNEDYIIPSVFNKEVAPLVAKEVTQVAIDQGLTKDIPKDLGIYI